MAPAAARRGPMAVARVLPDAVRAPAVATGRVPAAMVRVRAVATDRVRVAATTGRARVAMPRAAVAAAIAVRADRAGARNPIKGFFAPSAGIDRLSLSLSVVGVAVAVAVGA